MPSTTIKTPAGEIRTGSVICYSPDFGRGFPETVTVTEVDEDIKNGRAGFDASNGLWGYAHQVIHVVKF